MMPWQHLLVTAGAFLFTPARGSVDKVNTGSTTFSSSRVAQGDGISVFYNGNRT